MYEHEEFHCGDTLEVLVNNQWIQTRFKMSIDNEWYLVGTPYHGEDIEYVRARITE